MHRRNAVSGLVCLAFAIFVYWLSGSVPEGAALDPLGGAFLPRALAVALAVFSIALAITGFLGVQVKGGQATVLRPKEVGNVPSEEGMEAAPEEAFETSVAVPSTEGSQETTVGAGPETAPQTEDDKGSESTPAVIAYIAVMGLYVWLLPITGFLLTSFVLFSVFIYLLGQRNLIRAVMVSAFITAGLYGLFGMVFGVRLPSGSLF